MLSGRKIKECIKALTACFSNATFWVDTLPCQLARRFQCLDNPSSPDTDLKLAIYKKTPALIQNWGELCLGEQCVLCHRLKHSIALAYEKHIATEREWEWGKTKVWLAKVMLAKPTCT